MLDPLSCHQWTIYSAERLNQNIEVVLEIYCCLLFTIQQLTNRNKKYSKHCLFLKEVVFFSRISYKSFSHQRVLIDLTEPSKVDCNFFAEVFPDVVEWLVLVPLAPAGPVLVQDLTDVQLRWRGSGTWMLKWTLEKNSAKLDHQHEFYFANFIVWCQGPEKNKLVSLNRDQKIPNRRSIKKCTTFLILKNYKITKLTSYHQLLL